MKRFQLGATHITTALLRHMQDIDAQPMTYLVRHMSNDWGELGRDDKKANNDAIDTGGRLLSKYKLPDGQYIYCITEADRRSTTLMFTEEY